MRIHLNHPRFNWVGTENKELVMNRNENRKTLYHDQVEDFAVAQSADTLHVVALVGKKTLLYWTGVDGFESAEIANEHQIVGGLNLVIDDQQQLHVFYLRKNLRGMGCTLVHRYLKESWSDPIIVCTNATGTADDYHICHGLTGYLHLVYSSQTEGMLLYRGYDIKQRVWSGGVPLMRNECSLPHFFPTDTALLLTWIEEAKNNTLKGRWLTDQWSTTETLSDSQQDVFQPGYAWENGAVKVFWIQGGQLIYRVYDDGKWLPPISMKEHDYVLRQQLIVVNKGSTTCPIYEENSVEPQTRAEQTVNPQTTEMEVAETKLMDKQIASAERQESDLQNRFIQQAFQLHKEWQDLRTDYQSVLDLQANLTEYIDITIAKKIPSDSQLNSPETIFGDIEARVRDLSAKLIKMNDRLVLVGDDVRLMRSSAKSVSFEKLQQRIEKIEVKTNRSVTDSAVVNLEARIKLLEQELARVNQELVKLRSLKSAKRPMWRRLFRR